MNIMELNMKPLSTLDAVQKDFQQWRKLRKKRGSIPDDLWQRVLPLLNQYPISKICHETQIKGCLC